MVSEQAAAAAAPVESVVRTESAEMPVTAVTPEPAPLPEPVALREPAAAPATHAEPEAEPVHAEPVHAEPAASAPSVDIEKVLQESGLVMIKTDPSKVRPIEPVPEAPVVQPRPRPRRAPPADTGPLQIVETRKDA